MAKFKTAHFQTHGFIAVIVSPAFGKLRGAEQARHMGRLQGCAEAAGLLGGIVPVWKVDNTFEFLASEPYVHFLQTLGWDDIASRINGHVECG